MVALVATMATLQLVVGGTEPEQTAQQTPGLGAWPSSTPQPKSEQAAGRLAVLGALLVCFPLFRATDSAARWIYAAVVAVGWSIWLLAIVAKPPQRSDGIMPAPLAAGLTTAPVGTMSRLRL